MITQAFHYGYGQFNYLDASAYRDDPVQQLLSEGYSELPHSVYGVSRTYTCNNRAVPYAVLIENDEYRCVIFFNRLEDYVAHFRQWGMLSHVMHFMLPA
jgi:hypothetical protein